MPGANPIGRLAKNPIIKLAISDATAVAVVTLLLKFRIQSTASPFPDTYRQSFPNSLYRSGSQRDSASHVPPVVEIICGFTVNV